MLLGIDFNDLLYTHIARVCMCVGVCMHVCVCEGGSLTVPCTTVLETVVVTCACGHRVYNWELGLNNILLFFSSHSLSLVAASNFFLLPLMDAYLVFCFCSNRFLCAFICISMEYVVLFFVHLCILYHFVLKTIG